MKRQAIHLIVFLAAAGFAAIFVFVIGIYGFGWRSQAAEVFARLIPVPAAVVEGRVVTLHEAYQSGLPLSELLSGEVMALLAQRRGVENIAVALLAEKKTRAYFEAEAILRELKGGADFAETAAKYSEDRESRYIGGDLGIMAPGQIDPWLRPEALRLSIGQSGGIVISPAGYHILQVTGNSGGETIHLRHILIRDDSWQQIVTEEQKSMRIYVFTKL